MELRARLFWRRLRGRGGTAEGMALLALFLAAIPGSVVFAVVVGGGSFRAARAGQGAGVAVSVTAIFFGIWQTWTAVSLTLADRDGLDLRRFLTFPVPPGRVYALGLATSILGDPFSVFWLVALGGVLAGAALARPGAWLLVLALLLALFATATLALVALVGELGARLARSRHFRLYAVLAALAGWSLLLLAGAGWMRAPAALLAVLGRAQWIAFPAALTAAAARRLYSGETVAALLPLAALAAAAILAGLAAYRVALGTARAGGEGGAPPRRTERPGLLARLDPLLEKELRFLARHPVLRLYVVLLPILAAVLASRLAARPAGVAPELVTALPLLGVAAYVHLVAQPFWVNAFGWDRGGVRLLFLAPVAPTALLRAKNRGAAAAAALLFVLCAAAIASVGVIAGHPPPAWALAGAVVLHLGLGPIVHGLGNLVSILNPRAAAFGAQRAGRVAPLSALAGMGIVSLAAAAFAPPVLLAAHLEQPWIMVGGWAATGVAARALYRATLARVGALVAARRDPLLAAICGDEV